MAEGPPGQTGGLSTVPEQTLTGGGTEVGDTPPTGTRQSDSARPRPRKSTPGGKGSPSPGSTGRGRTPGERLRRGIEGTSHAERTKGTPQRSAMPGGPSSKAGRFLTAASAAATTIAPRRSKGGDTPARPPPRHRSGGTCGGRNGAPGLRQRLPSPSGCCQGRLRLYGGNRGHFRSEPTTTIPRRKDRRGPGGNLGPGPPPGGPQSSGHPPASRARENFCGRRKAELIRGRKAGNGPAKLFSGQPP